ncbi:MULTISPECIES: DNA translocase FtsK [unclassified Paenibacillus]|uniref:FtsK/SpoIIIE family DNA translocase n=1 Tax=unclassified Paenibacillus TaxID=185978 RepID=UPI001AE735AF|nr:MULTISPECIES: DNA translocase FtsK [unclassified Paenibacillus]MBP1155945.1 S-DNA-T family DNA segregation ATPase FtsK/SpoIIIE [Paenibacillus sp. PvP091]MBP1168669.1 S-DNA-T family DNA segregation ATPase FtsK/SpoIIIE [Paenibacillus sp. PvR098]MBP2439697.1 S-DNA-T family DNA segregation ATPase FtsK/SpoIIIE [Paenibacillus sp. PvP052]
MSKKRKRGKGLKTNLKFELYGILILTLSIIALSREGSVARALTYLFRFLIGTWDFVIPLVFIYAALYAMMKRGWPIWRTSRKGGLLLIVLSLLLMSHISLFAQLYEKAEFTAGQIWSQTWISMVDGLEPTMQGQEILTAGVGGGMIGAFLYSVLYYLFDNLGARLIQYTMFIAGFLLMTGLSLGDVLNRMGGRKPFVDTLLGQYIKRKLQERHHRKQAAAGGEKKKKPAAVYVPEPDEEYDEETLKPEKKQREPGRKGALFFELLNPVKGRNKSSGKNSSSIAMDSSSDAEEEMKTVYSREEAELSSKQDAEAPVVVTHDPAIPVIRDFQEQVKHETVHATKHGGESADSKVSQQATKESGESEGNPEDFDIKNKPLDIPYELPSLQLLTKPSSGKSGDSLDYKAVARKLEATLESFGVRAKVLEVVRGPAVTRYEIQPDVGVKVSRIVSLTDDIALALAAKDIRMEAPIPGKSAIGIEVPNTEVSVVTMREVMESPTFQEAASKLSITLGRDISGQPIVGNLSRMPHLLVAGATGSGKSVCINGIITSVLYKAKPDEVKFLMIDPKMVELNVYNGIPHLLAPVVTDPKRASLALKKVVVEMEKRYELFSKSGTRNIEGYNAMLLETQTGAPLPYIVVIVDELADLMMVAANDVEDAICRLAQMARAAGIHLIIATQRPSVDVITGVIKANIPSRIAFGVSSQVDSRTILDSVGAEKLLGRGDMLYLPMGASKPVRVQGAFLSDPEVEAVVNFVRTQGQAEYVEDMVPHVEEKQEDQNEFEDALYDQAVQIILEAKQASVSLLQRRMRVGYTRAARLIDTMEARGIVGPYEGSKPREVLVSLEQYQLNRMSS